MCQNLKKDRDVQGLNANEDDFWLMDDKIIFLVGQKFNPKLCCEKGRSSTIVWIFEANDSLGNQRDDFHGD